MGIEDITIESIREGRIKKDLLREARKPKNRIDCDTHRDHLRKDAPDALKGAVDKWDNGSVHAAVKLHCCQCVGYSSYQREIRECTSKVCPMWPERPYQRNDEQEE